jgi:hypothetical protein
MNHLAGISFVRAAILCFVDSGSIGNILEVAPLRWKYDKHHDLPTPKRKAASTRYLTRRVLKIEKLC